VPVRPEAARRPVQGGTPALVGAPERQPEPDEWAAKHALLGIADEPLQLGAHIVVAEREGGAQEARERCAQILSDQRRQHDRPSPKTTTYRSRSCQEG
jgi:hypothetical protein